MANDYNNLPDEYRPISMWGYFGYELLFSIPIVGLILLLVFSFGGTKNVNLRNFARSYFCFLIVIVIFAIIIAIIGATPYPTRWMNRLSEGPKTGRVLAVAAPVALMALLAVVTAYLVDGSFNPFLYFRF